MYVLSKFHDKETKQFDTWHCCDVQSTRPIKQLMLSLSLSFNRNETNVFHFSFNFYYFARKPTFFWGWYWTHKILINSSLPLLLLYSVQETQKKKKQNNIFWHNISLVLQITSDFFFVCFSFLFFLQKITISIKVFMPLSRKSFGGIIPRTIWSFSFV